MYNELNLHVQQVLLTSGNSMPIYQLWISATRSTTAATVFMSLTMVISTIVCIATANTASRLTWALGRDNAFYGSQYLGKNNQKLQVPVWSIVANAVIVGIFGFLYLASTTGT